MYVAFAGVNFPDPFFYIINNIFFFGQTLFHKNPEVLYLMVNSVLQKGKKGVFRTEILDFPGFWP